MRHGLMAVAAVVAMAGAAAAQDGGKLPWKKDPQAALAEARKTGKPTFMFFTSEG